MRRKILLFAFAFLLSMFGKISAEDFIVDGIRYQIVDDYSVVVIQLGEPLRSIVDNPTYSGDITIPAVVKYNDVKYTVEGINSYAFQYCANLNSVTISEGVSYIFDYAFVHCPNLTSITIPNSVTYIGYQALHETGWYENQPDGVIYAGKVAYTYKGEMLQDTCLVLKDSIVSISDNAFEDCANLVSIKMPSTLLSIGSYAFSGCSKLDSISVPESVTSIGIHAFDGTAWYNALPYGVIYAGPMLYGHKGDNVLGDTLVVQEGTRIINRQSLTRQSRVKAIFFPESVESIGVEAFYHCQNLDSISFPNNLRIISPYAFAECVKLESITLPFGLSYIGNGAFDRCDNLTNITTQAIYPPYLAQDAFPSTVYTKAVLYVPKESINSYKNADGWKQFSNIEAIGGNAVDFIVDGIRYEAVDDTSVVVMPLGDPILTSGNPTYSGNITIPAKVTYNEVEYRVVGIGNHAFYNCSSLNSVTISEGIEYISAYALSFCSDLTSISIPNSVISVDKGAFIGTTWYENLPDGVVYIGRVAYTYKYKGTMSQDTCIVLKEGTVSITDGAFERCSNLVSIELPSTLNNIGMLAFSGCIKLDSISIPESVKRIGLYAFIATGWFNALPEGPIYFGSMLFGRKGFDILEDTFAIKEGTKIVNIMSFTGQNRLKTLIFPESLEVIDERAFDYCDSLTEITSIATVPPTLIKNAFTTTVYENAILYVPAESVNSYKTAEGWKDFLNIVPIGTTGVTKPEANNVVAGYYDLSGKRIEEPQKGLNIIKYTNGQTKKLFIK
jgi:hypothetical protein